MIKIFAVLALLGSAIIGQAKASDTLYITSDYYASTSRNVASVSALGDDNAIAVQQIFTGRGGANSLDIDIIGDLNGGPLTSAFKPTVAEIGLQPGQIVQTGHDNSVAMSIRGTGNLFAASQVGSHNMLTASVMGNNNQSAVSQTGYGNSLSFSQNGNGNSLTVIQRAY
ncbi:hypothetical protein PSQ19_10985 [Devosia algicola]|uniref:Curlin associated repeat-containing protein n=1 Tax=Devosia algicola TaxID=3026418 RepID=A0ABY7YJA8_9HYPH|nr:hypothetical protein [Devosia algicola]WDR01351.1 hypothetical protein PSQ19_10985 [Devosia algicola]